MDRRAFILSTASLSALSLLPGGAMPLTVLERDVDASVATQKA